MSILVKFYSLPSPHYCSMCFSAMMMKLAATARFGRSVKMSSKFNNGDEFKFGSRRDDEFSLVVDERESFPHTN
jgi:hypothetical protein